jgi:hypothetical protein
MKEAISHFAVTRNFRVLVYFSCPFVIPVPYQPPRDEFYFLPLLTLTANLIPCSYPPFLYWLFQNYITHLLQQGITTCVETIRELDSFFFLQTP